MKRFIPYLIILASVLLYNSNAEAQQKKNSRVREPAEATPIVVFVCEHGSAKSVVSAEHFNKLSRERNSKLRAISRGTNPDEQMPASTIKGLQADGISIGEQKPQKLSHSDFAGAVRVITFCELPDPFTNRVPVVRWDDVPPMSADYGRFRDIIVERIKRLLDELEPAK